VDAADSARRLANVRGRAAAAGVEAVVVTPGADLRWLIGYDAVNLERLTCLVLPTEGEPLIVVPRLERPAAEAVLAGGARIDVNDWDDGDDPYVRVAGSLGRGLRTVALDADMPARHVLALRGALAGVDQVLSTPILEPLRAVKDATEIAALRRAGAAIDRVQARVGEWLKAGRSEAEVARDVAAAVVAEGHDRVDFVIVGSGPNAASPHHTPGDRVIEPGDAVVVDIGGTMPDGYCSDCTRTYAVGEPPRQFAAYFEVLRQAQEAGCEAVRPGAPIGSVDQATREPIEQAGYAGGLLHRTGHGIGLQTHEAPYVVAGNDEPLSVGMAFSVEPGIYLAGRHGARIEDIVVCTETGAERLNQRPRELAVLPA
jgi:Xaa-Pro aminopeptidase